MDNQINGSAEFRPEADGTTFTAIITSDSADRQSEVVLPEGINVSKYVNTMGNIFYNHDYTELPVGYLDKTKPIERNAKHIIMSGKFLDRPENHVGEWFPDSVKSFLNQFYKAGFKVGVSIGFRPIETRKPTKKDKQICYDRCIEKGLNREDAEIATNRLDSVVSKCELMEFSIAPMQANQDAIITSVTKGFITKSAAEFAGVKVPDDIEVKFTPEDTHPNCKCEIKNDTWLTQPGCCDKCEGMKEDFNSLQGESKTLVLSQMEKEEGDLHSRFSKARELINAPKVEDKKTIHMLVVLPSKSHMNKDDVALEVRKALAKSWGRNYLPE